MTWIFTVVEVFIAIKCRSVGYIVRRRMLTASQLWKFVLGFFPLVVLVFSYST